MLPNLRHYVELIFSFSANVEVSSENATVSFIASSAETQLLNIDQRATMISEIQNPNRKASPVMRTSTEIRAAPTS